MNKKAILTPEHRFLLECGRFIQGGDTAPTGAVPPPDLNWERLLQTARRNRLTAQLYRCVTPHKDRVPEEAWAVLESRAHAIEHKNEIVSRELLRLDGQFLAAGCPMLPYKGPVLAALAYGDLALRQFSDLDLLIPRRAIHGAARLLESAGYRLHHRSQRSADAVYLGTEYHYLYRHLETGIAVELHGEAIPCYFSFPLTNDELWERQEAYPLLGQRIASISREDLALLLSMHGAKHEWECAELALSLACMLRASPDLNWEALLARAGSLGARRVLLLGVSLAWELFGYCPPAPVRAAIGSDPVLERLTGEVWEYFLGIRKPGTSALQTALFQVRSRERLRDRVSYWLLRIFAPNWEELEWLPLPRSLFPLYWVLRPIRLVWHYTPEVLGLTPPRAATRGHQ